VFRRRRRDVEDAERLGPGYDTDDEAEDYDDLDSPEDYQDDDGPVRAPAAVHGTGPWDATESYPQRERVDFGSLLVPGGDEFEIRINMADATTGVSVDILRGDPAQGGSGLQLQAFAAPKSSGLWDEVRQEIAEEVAKSGGRSEETQGPHGTELYAVVGAAGQRQEPSRFLGVDGPRWFLRGVISGPAASHREQARPFEELFADVVVVRGEHPVPPRELLLLRLPEDAQQALAEQSEQGQPQYPSPFERGPEITETR
jgi:Protein of unknown function (DUF3710)